MFLISKMSCSGLVEREILGEKMQLEFWEISSCKAQQLLGLLVITTTKFASTESHPWALPGSQQNLALKLAQSSLESQIHRGSKCSHLSLKNLRKPKATNFSSASNTKTMVNT